MQDQLPKIAFCLRLPLPVARNIMLLSAARDAKDVSPICAAEEMSLSLGSWLLHTVRLPSDAIALLLKEMLPLFREISPEILRIWVTNDNTVAVPAHELHLVEHRYALWHPREQFWDTNEACYLNPLPHQPLWRTSVRLSGLYFAYLHRKASKNVDQAAHTTGSAG